MAISWFTPQPHPSIDVSVHTAEPCRLGRGTSELLRRGILSPEART